jgi:hypothetical protein
MVSSSSALVRTPQVIGTVGGESMVDVLMHRGT